MKKYITKKTVSIALGVLLLGGLSYFIYYSYQMVQIVKYDTSVIHAMLTPDKDGITGFDRLTLQSVKKIQVQQ